MSDRSKEEVLRDLDSQLDVEFPQGPDSELTMAIQTARRMIANELKTPWPEREGENNWDTPDADGVLPPVQRVAAAS